MTMNGDQRLRSVFTIVEVNDLFILLIDNDIGRSVTNDAEAVIDWINSCITGGIGERKVYYRDTADRFDQLLVSNGQFNGFLACSESQQDQFGKLCGLTTGGNMMTASKERGQG